MCCGSHAADNSPHDLSPTRLSAGMQGSRREQFNTLSVPGSPRRTRHVSDQGVPLGSEWARTHGDQRPSASGPDAGNPRTVSLKEHQQNMGG
jgi:hypothetical protein